MKRKLFSGCLAVAMAGIAMLNFSIVKDSNNRSIVRMTTLAGVAAAVSAANSEAGDSGGQGLFDEEHPSTVHCTATNWSRTDYYSSSGSLLGYTLLENGVFSVQYTGSYSSSVTSSGGVAAHDGTKIDCFGWGWGCTPVSAIQACA